MSTISGASASKITPTRCVGELDVSLDALVGRVMQRTDGAVPDDLTAMLLSMRSASRQDLA